MAYPDDEQYGASAQSTDTNTVANTPVAPNTSGVTGNNTVPPPIGASPAAARTAQIQSILPRIQPAIVVAPNSAVNERDANFNQFGNSFGLSGITNGALNIHPELKSVYNQHVAANAAAADYHAAAAHMTQLGQDTQKNLDSGDFLSGIANLDHTSPTYESALAKLWAAHPLADGSAVHGAVAAQQQGRANYLHGTSPAGASQFDDGSPEQQAYITRLHQTNNPQAAEAHAKNVQTGEAMIHTSIANKTFDPNLLKWSDDGSQPLHPEFFNADHTVNYHAVGLQAAKTAAAKLDETDPADKVKEQAAQEKTRFEAAQAVLKSYKTPPDESDLSYKDYMAAHATVNARMRGTLGAAPGVAPVGTAPAAVAPIAPVVTPAATPSSVKTAKDYTKF